jgi:hypothetical protein
MRGEVKDGLIGMPQIEFLGFVMQLTMFVSLLKSRYGHLARTVGEVTIEESRV